MRQSLTISASRTETGRIASRFAVISFLGASVACIFANPATAQTGASQLPGTAPVQTTGLAAGDRFPSTFLPFHYDWRIQTVALPGRAAFAKSGFVALEFDREPSLEDVANKNRSSAGPQISYILLSARRNRLFAASLGGYRRSTGRDVQYVAPQLSETNSNRHAVDASMRFVAIKHAANGAGLYVGVHGRYHDNLDKATTLTAASTSTVNNQIARRDTGSSAAINRSLERTISLGVEAGRSAEDLDVILDATYHRSLQEFEVNRSSYSVTDTRTTTPLRGDPDFSRRERTSSEVVENSGRLNSISGAAYLRRQSDLANRSVFFITNVVIGFGDVLGQSSVTSADRHSDFLNDVRIDFRESVNDQTVPLSDATSSWLFRVGSGIELHRTYGSVTASGGFSAEIISSNYKNIPVPGANLRLLVESPYREAILTMPALAYIEVYRDITLFAGVIFRTSYSYDKETILLPAPPNTDLPLTITTNTSTYITSQYPIGILASHPSGFFLEAAFRGSFATYDTWRVTLGLDLD